MLKYHRITLSFCHHYCSCWLWMVYCGTALDRKKRGLTWKLQKSLEDMEYADDVCLISHKYEHMCRKLDDLWKESKKAGLEINSSKTEKIHINTIVKQRHRLNGDEIKKSSDFCYLGSIVSENGGTSREVSCEYTEGDGIILQIKNSVAIQVITKGH